MKKKLLTIILVALTAFAAASLFTGCITASGGASLGEDGSAKFEGKTLTVDLAGNSTTGYEWTYTIDGSNLTCVKDEYTTNVTVNSSVGVSGTQTFVFNTTGQGEATVTFTYARSWEKSADDKTYSVTIKAGSNGVINSLAASEK